MEIIRFKVHLKLHSHSDFLYLFEHLALRTEGELVYQYTTGKWTISFQVWKVNDLFLDLSNLAKQIQSWGTNNHLILWGKQ